MSNLVVIAFEEEHKAFEMRAELVKLRYFLGCTVAESAEILGIAPATAEEDWTYAKAWLRRELRRDDEERLPE